MNFVHFLQLAIGKSGFIFIFLTVFIAVIMISQMYSKKNKMLRKLKEHSFKRIQLCKEGEYIKIKGKAFPIDKALSSSLSERKCLYYNIQIEERRSNGKSSSWRTVIKEERFQNFIIENEGAKAIIMAKTPKSHKTTYLNQDVAFTSGTWKDAPEFLERYLRTHGRKSTGFLGFNKSLRYKEGIIEIGEKVTVLGIGNWKESDHNFDRYSSKTLYISGNDQKKLIITDHTKALLPKNK